MCNCKEPDRHPSALEMALARWLLGLLDRYAAPPLAWLTRLIERLPR